MYKQLLFILFSTSLFAQNTEIFSLFSSLEKNEKLRDWTAQCVEQLSQEISLTQTPESVLRREWAKVSLLLASPHKRIQQLGSLKILCCYVFAQKYHLEHLFSQLQQPVKT